MKQTLLLTFIIISFGFNACNVINPSEDIPTFIEIDSVTVISTDMNKHGSISHKITDAWVYYDNELLGAFELPAKVPVLANSKGQLQIVAGIWDNGLSGTRVKYPFYMLDTFSFNASPTNTLKYTPKFRYRTTDNPLVKYYIENFEQGNSFIKLSGDSNMVRTNASNEVFEGDFSGKITLNDSIKQVVTVTSENFVFEPNKECYMELNYKSESDFVVKLKVLYNNSIITVDVIGLKAKNNWTKVYINLGGFTSTFQYGNFQFLFDAQLPSNMNKSDIFIDNFKLVYYK